MSKVHRVAGLRISRIQPTLMSDEVSSGSMRMMDQWKPSNDLPDLAPPEPSEEALRMSKMQIFSSDLLSVTHSTRHDDVFEETEATQEKDLVARATVYAMNGIVAAVSLPVGLALLAFNVLGGENIRTTSHVIALTGVGTALAQTEHGIWLLGMF